MNNNRKDFLADGKFVLWALTGDRELREYWDEVLEKDPGLRDDFDAAVARFGKLRLSGGELSGEEYRRLRDRIVASVTHSKPRRRERRWIGYAAACFFVLIGFSIYMLIGNEGGGDEIEMAGRHIIVGENLNDEEISLISGSSYASFAGEVHVQIDDEGKTIVEEAGGGKRTVVEEAAGMNKLSVPYGKRSRLTLPDGTKVRINSGSVLEFPTVFNDNEPRSISLSGEIYVEVAPDPGRPFYVDTKDFRIRVYGTAFNVSAYNDGEVQSVVLVNGKLSVSDNINGEMFLSPNEKLSGGLNNWNREPVDITEYVSWKDGYLLLNGAPIASVLKRMERFYNLSFTIGDGLNLEAISCTGKLSLSENIDEVMSAVSFLSGTNYRRDGGTIYIEY